MTDDDLGALDPNVQWIIAEARRPVVVDAAARARLLAAVRSAPRPERRSRVRAWLLEPRHLALPPLAALAAAAGLVGIGVISGLAFNRDGRPPIEQGMPVAVKPQLPDSVAPRVIKFVLVAPQASRVSLVGDFNRWDAAAAPAAKQSDGSWAIFVPLTPGRHVYSFVVDGMHFVPDPSAPVAPDDGYGQKNSVVVVKGATS
jgi:hypothetical protein